MIIDGKVSAILIHVADVTEGIEWYAKAFPAAKRIYLDDFDFEYLLLGDICLEIVRADEKVQSGQAGSVVYWEYTDFQQALNHFQTLGATLYRGPLAIQDNLKMCQIMDPWGNCIGLRGV